MLGITVYGDNINKAYSLLHSSDSFRLSLPGKTTFICEQGICLFISNGSLYSSLDMIFPLNNGENKLEGFNATVVVEEKSEKSFSNVYNYTTDVIIPSDIIEGEIYLRFRRDGDGYRYGGLSRKLKKVFNDRKIPPYMRDRIPLICDNKGILWCPGLPVRDFDSNDSGSQRTRIGIIITEKKENESEIYLAKK